jgi:hypothetical protein
VTIFNIDCYGYGISTGTIEGHDPGDARAALEAQRARRLVRNILMAGTYTYLGFPRREGAVVWRRWLLSETAFQPQIDGRQVQHVQAVRLALQVEFSELSPQVPSVTLELISAQVKRTETGQLLLRADYPQS